ncbi:PadR family transcriptional regulator [Demequina globuliformis]|uniref:PadR family transcriptional regulator n=1 Tax=Demequina globuliformis TaxID=676202 RepID=UPI0007813D3E|nr:PadR family transcriptional regulator [Demequina globuliformis]
MTSGFRSAGRHSNPGEAVWEAVQQMRAGVEKKVGTRMGRGDVRAAVLALLSEDPMHGYQIIREIEERTDGRWKPSAGSVYPTLQLLADEGLVTAETVQDRKVYTLTPEATEQAAAAAASAPWAASDEPEAGQFSALSKAGFDLAQAAGQVATSGTKEQQRRVTEVLNESRRKIYSILAED